MKQARDVCAEIGLMDFLQLASFIFCFARQGIEVRTFSAYMKVDEKIKRYGINLRATEPGLEFNYFFKSLRERNLWLKEWEKAYATMVKEFGEYTEYCDKCVH